MNDKITYLTLPEACDKTLVGDHSVSTYTKSKLSYPLIYTCICACQGVENVSFSENFADVSNKRSLVKSSRSVQTSKMPSINEK